MRKSTDLRKLTIVQANAVMRTLQISDRPTKLAQAIAELGASIKPFTR